MKKMRRRKPESKQEKEFFDKNANLFLDDPDDPYRELFAILREATYRYFNDREFLDGMFK